jgi:MoaA/NifB/PqqE/SkfB family radical SAM enzyme
MIEATPTKRAWIDSGRLCNALCSFCYYKHTAHQGYKSLQENCRKVDFDCIRGCNYEDISGGEPTILPYIVDLINYIHSKNIKCCVITNGLANEDITKKLLDANTDDFLISMHGLESVHDTTVNVQDAFRKQDRFISQVQEKMSFRFNCVISKSNQNSLVEIAKHMSTKKPRIVNFINFNPFHDWGRDALEIIADLRIVELQLNNAIAILEDKGIGVNIRYYPLCRISEEYRRCVCNYNQLLFDPYEWDFEQMPRTKENYRRYCVSSSNDLECKTGVCATCDLHVACGGINNATNNLTCSKMIDSIKLAQKITDFFYYRKFNVLTL